MTSALLPWRPWRARGGGERLVQRRSLSSSCCGLHPPAPGSCRLLQTGHHAAKQCYSRGSLRGGEARQTSPPTSATPGAGVHPARRSPARLLHSGPRPLQGPGCQGQREGLQGETNKQKICPKYSPPPNLVHKAIKPILDSSWTPLSLEGSTLPPPALSRSWSVQ